MKLRAAPVAASKQLILSILGTG